VGERLSGRTPGVHLNALGHQQAATLARRLAGLSLSAVYSSPLTRAVETADPLAVRFKLDKALADDFQEIDFGQWTDLAFSELDNDPQFKLFNSYRSSTRIPGGELMLEAQARIVNGLNKLRIQHPGETVAVVSHSDLIKSAIAYYAGIPLELFHRIEISPASVSIIELFDETARIILINHTGEIHF
jgi:probable phosphoglycerate mutase